MSEVFSNTVRSDFMSVGHFSSRSPSKEFSEKILLDNIMTYLFKKIQKMLAIGAESFF